MEVFLHFNCILRRNPASPQRPRICSVFFMSPTLRQKAAEITTVFLNLLNEKKICLLNATVLGLLISCQTANNSEGSSCGLFTAHLSSFCSSGPKRCAHPAALWVLVYSRCGLHLHTVMNHWMNSQMSMFVTSVFSAAGFWCLSTNFYTNSVKAEVTEMGLRLKGNEIKNNLVLMFLW